MLVGLPGPPLMKLLSRGEQSAVHFESNGEFKNKELIPWGFALADSAALLEGEDPKRLFLKFARKMP